MTSRSYLLGAAALGVAAIVLTGSLVAGEEKNTTARPREAVLTGTVTDLHSFMSGEIPKLESSRQRIYLGGPAVLMTETGPVLLGRDKGTPKPLILEALLQPAEVRGLLHEREGLRYLDLTALRPTKPVRRSFEQDDEWPDDHEADEGDIDEDEEEDEDEGNDEEDPY